MANKKNIIFSNIVGNIMEDDNKVYDLIHNYDIIKIEIGEYLWN